MSYRMVWRSVVGVSLLLLTACSSFELKSTAGFEGLVVEDDWTVRTFHGSYWPFSWSGSGSGPESDVIKCKKDGKDNCVGIHSVKYHTNLGYALGAVLTLGLWVPETVEWRCRVPAEDDSGAPIFTGDDDEMGDDGPEGEMGDDGPGDEMGDDGPEDEDSAR